MMSTIAFHKMVASGNDFIVIDNRKGAISDPKAFAREFCPAHTGIGADGLLLVEPSKKADFFMRIVNADGSEAEACGNGYRIMGLYAQKVLGLGKSIEIETLAGAIKIHVNSASIKVKMTDPSDYRKDITIRDLQVKTSRGGQDLHAAYINTGVPHVVIFTEGLETIPVAELGRAIRRHKMFQPKGANVNFAEVTGKNELTLRTYERGVEAETLACGTGTVASAVVGHLTDRISAPVHVKTKSGETLKVYLERSGLKVRNVFLEGGAKFVYEGRLVA